MPATDLEFLRSLTIEPLDRKKHDRAAFDSGVSRVDHFIAATAGRHHDEDQSKTYVVVTTGTVRVLGFYTLCPHAIDLSSLPEDIRRKLGRAAKVSALYLAIIGVDKTVAGKGLGRYLMADFLRTCIRVIDLIGGKFIVLDAIDEKTAAFYRKLGFIDLPSQPLRMLMNAEKARRAIG